MSTPSNTMRPLLAGSVPASTAMNVDLPAPFGPMRPVILPRGTSSDTPSTARIPSKWRFTSSAASIGCSGIGSAFIDTTRLGANAFGPEPQESEDEQSDQDPLERRDQVGRSDVHACEESRHLLEPDRNEQGAEDGADVVAATADDDGREQDDRLRIEPGRRRPHLQEADQDRARQSSDRAADDEHRQLQSHRVLAEGGGGQLVVAHRAERAAERGADDPRRDEPHDGHANG